MPHSIARSGIAVSAMKRPSGSSTPRLVEPLQRRIGVHQRFGRGEGLRRNRDQRMFGIELGEHLGKRRAIDVDDHRDVIAVAVAPQRIDEQVGAERRSADADVEQVTDLAERACLDRVDHHPHPLVQSLRTVDRVGGAVAALGAMFGGAVLGRIGDAARKQRLAPPVEILRYGKVGQDRHRGVIQMRLGKVETDVRHAAHQRLQPRVRISGDQVGQLLRLPVGERLPGLVGGVIISPRNPFVSSEVETSGHAPPMGISTSLDANGMNMAQSTGPRPALHQRHPPIFA